MSKADSREAAAVQVLTRHGDPATACQHSAGSTFSHKPLLQPLMSKSIRPHIPSKAPVAARWQDAIADFTISKIIRRYPVGSFSRVFSEGFTTIFLR